MTARCIKCFQIIDTFQLYLWSSCEHQYCMKCAAHIANQLLSEHNKIPTCIQSKCNQVLNINDAHRLQHHLLAKYKVRDDLMSYNYEYYLIHGYIRETFRNTSKEISGLIFEFYNLNILHYSSKISCIYCTASGYNISNCSHCNKYGTSFNCTEPKMFTKDCEECNEAGYHVLEKKCNTCINYKKQQKYVVASERIYKYDKYQIQCIQCKGIGRYRILQPCVNCGGKGAIYKQRDCMKCIASNSFKHKCINCNGIGSINNGICNKCSGYKKIITLDFKKLIRNQSLCVKCKYYFPNYMILHWNNCHHSYCIECLPSYIVFEINNDRIPVCCAMNCKQELMTNVMASMRIKDKHLCDNLEKLIYEKHSFLCIQCKCCIHFDELFLWSKCNHKYCKKCAAAVVCEYLSIFNRIPQCKHFRCKQLLCIEHGDVIKHMLPKMYQIKSNQQELKTYNDKMYLIDGYIRKIKYIKYIPKEIIQCIFDYYYLIISSQINCYVCKSFGYQLIQCERCDGIGYIKQSFDIIKSKGKYPILQTGYVRNKCLICNGTGNKALRCIKCDGTSKLIVLDFNKLCNKQTECDKCNKYVPNNMILFWSNCYHRYCYKCISKYTKKQFDNRQIPICVTSNCGQEIDKEFVMEHMPLIFNKTFWSHPFRLLNQLENLYFRKNRFLCSHCYEWHLDKQLFLWTNCNHEYGIKCVKLYIQNYLSENKSILNVFKSHRIPKCERRDCDELLDITDAIMLGITTYQYKTLNYLHRESVDIDLNYEDKIYLQHMTETLFNDSGSISPSDCST
eukprot:318575_1